MKLAPVVEVTNPYADAIHDYIYARPTETEADLIAATARPGDVTIREMAQIVANECPGRGCGLCQMSGYQVPRYFASIRAKREISMKYFDVEWDPDIRL